jgi:hypothetical protein
MNPSLITGWFPWSVAALSVGVTGAGLLGHWRRAAIAIGAWWGLAGGAFAVTGGRIMGTDLPMSVFLSGAVPVVGLVAASMAVGRDRRWWRRTAAIAAAPLMVLTGLIWLDRWFAYYPTLGSLFASAPPKFAGQAAAAGAIGTPGSSPRGQLFSIDYPAGRSHFHHRMGIVWLPPAWSTKERRHLGVIELIAGVPGDPRSWLHGTDVIHTAIAFASRHRGMAPVLVFPDANGSWGGDTECVDGSRGKAETYLTSDIRYDVGHQLGVSTDPRQWAIGGLSAGGTCGLMLDLRHPDAARTFLDISGEVRPEIGDRATTTQALYGGSDAAWWAHDPATLLRTHRYDGMAGVFAAGHRRSTGPARRRPARSPCPGRRHRGPRRPPPPRQPQLPLLRSRHRPLARLACRPSRSARAAAPPSPHRAAGPTPARCRRPATPQSDPAIGRHRSPASVTADHQWCSVAGEWVPIAAIGSGRSNTEDIATRPGPHRRNQTVRLV